MGLIVTLTVENNTTNNCSPRVVTANVSNGSGFYQYFWNANPPSDAVLANGSSLSVEPGAPTTFTVFVIDTNNPSVFGTTNIQVVPVLKGSFNTFIPNAFTPNGDGVNDSWGVFTASLGTGPINAFRYELNIVNRFGSSVYSKNETISSGSTGVLGGQIVWNGLQNGTGPLVPAGTYFYSLRLINCTNNQLFNGNIQVLY